MAFPEHGLEAGEAYFELYRSGFLSQDVENLFPPRSHPQLVRLQRIGTQGPERQIPLRKIDQRPQRDGKGLVPGGRIDLPVFPNRFPLEATFDLQEIAFPPNH